MESAEGRGDEAKLQGALGVADAARLLLKV
jgi:hypothetical protein